MLFRPLIHLAADLCRYGVRIGEGRRIAEQQHRHLAAVFAVCRLIIIASVITKSVAFVKCRTARLQGAFGALAFQHERGEFLLHQRENLLTDPLTAKGLVNDEMLEESPPVKAPKADKAYFFVFTFHVKNVKFGAVQHALCVCIVAPLVGDKIALHCGVNAVKIFAFDRSQMHHNLMEGGSCRLVQDKNGVYLFDGDRFRHFLL